MGSATGGAFQRNLVAIHDELLDLASSFAGLAASGTPMATNAQGAAAHSPQEQAAAAASARLTAEVSMAHAVTCGAIASHIVSVRGLEATTSLRRVASLPTERALEPTDAMGGATPAPASETAAALANASSTAAVTKNATHVAKQPSVGVSGDRTCCHGTAKPLRRGGLRRWLEVQGGASPPRFLILFQLPAFSVAFLRARL